MFGEEIRKFVEGDIKEFGRLFVENNEETIAIPWEELCLQAEKQDGHRIHSVYAVYEESLMSAQMIDVSLIDGEMVLHVEGMHGQWSNDEGKEQMSPPPPPPWLNPSPITSQRKPTGYIYIFTWYILRQSDFAPLKHVIKYAADTVIRFSLLPLETKDR